MSDETTHDAPSDQAAERSAEPAPQATGGATGPAVPPRPLRPKQRRFVEEYLIDLNATQAAIRAGYSPRTARSVASELLTNPNISAAVRYGLDKRSASTALTAEWVVARLRENLLGALSDTPPQRAAANGAMALLGKHLGLFPEKLDVTSNGQTIVQLVSAVPRPATNGVPPPNRLRETVGS